MSDAPVPAPVPLAEQAARRGELMRAAEQFLSALRPSWRSDPEMRDTPRRFADAWWEMTRGYREGPDCTMFPTDYDGIIVRCGIPFTSICAHHTLPYTGQIDFAYVPGERKIGISKIIRLVQWAAARFTSQEELSDMIVAEFEKAVHPKGVFVVIGALHGCEALRGVRVAGVPTGTSAVAGVFRERPEARAEAEFLFSHLKPE